MNCGWVQGGINETTVICSDDPLPPQKKKSGLLRASGNMYVPTRDSKNKLYNEEIPRKRKGEQKTKERERENGKYDKQQRWTYNLIQDGTKGM